LYFYRKFFPHPVNAVTISGGADKNEIPATKMILSQYDNISHLTGEVGESMIHSLPDIVWRYEGYLFQEGMFLRYELAKLLNENDSGYIFLGSGGDQILDPNINNDILFSRVRSFKQSVVYFFKNFISRTFLGDIYYKIFGSKDKEEHILRKKLGRSIIRKTFETHVDMNLKLHEVMLNSFGIQGVYPFVNNETAMLFRGLGELIYKKQFYKEEAERVLGTDITQYIEKSGQVVDTHKLFSANKELLLRIFQLKFVQDLLSKAQLSQIIESPDQYYMLILQLVYIYIFNETFITGRYDEKFDMDGLDIKLMDMIYSTPT
jgi:hypothetical protein